MRPIVGSKVAKQKQWEASETVSPGDEMVRLGASGISGGMAEGGHPGLRLIS